MEYNEPSSLEDQIFDASVALAPPGILPDLDAPLEPATGELIHAAFLRNVEASPDAPALRHHGEIFSYTTIEERSRGLARALLAKGIGPGSRVVIIAERQPWLVWALLAASRIGAVFILLDAAYPARRIETLADIGMPDAVLASSGSPGWTIATELATERSIPLVDTLTTFRGDESPLPEAIDPAAPAYYLFTSGSTGVPKCVACSHIPLAHFIRWQAQTFDLSSDDRFTMLSGLSHDPLMRDIFAPLSRGATLLIPDQEEIFGPGKLASWFEAMQPTVAHMTPAMAQLLTAARSPRALDCLRRIFMGGDMLRPQVIDALCALAPNAEVTNFYGATETPQAAGYYRWRGDEALKAAPVGKGSDGFQLAIVDQDYRPRGIGEEGEIAIRSNYLSLGYVEAGAILADPDDRGIDRFGRRTIYHTGDRGYYLPDGNIAIIGRQDDQIKVRGYRVDLAEVASALAAHPDIEAAFAVAPASEFERSITAIFVGVIDDVDGVLTQFLGERLPSYMVPAKIVRIDAMPLLPNGKLDRRALEALAEADLADAVVEVDLSPGEAALISAWSGLLNRRMISRDSSYASLGGDSLSYVQVYLATEDLLGVMPEDWAHMSVRQLAGGTSAKRSIWGTIDTAMLIRAGALMMVLAYHFSMFPGYPGGATSGLFLVSGFLFGHLQLTESVMAKSVRPVLRLMVSILVPTILYCAAAYAFDYFTGRQVSVSTPLLYSNFIGKAGVGREFYLWYLHCIIQLLGMTAIAFVVASRSARLTANPYRVSAAMLAVAVPLKFIVPALFFHNFLILRTGLEDLAQYIPTTHWPTFILGAMIAFVRSLREKAFMATMLALYAGATALFFPDLGWAFIAASGALLLLVKRLPILKLLNRPILMISGASLFIYLTHLQFKWMLDSAGTPIGPRGLLVIAIVGGVGLWLAWQKLRTLAHALSRKLATG